MIFKKQITDISTVLNSVGNTTKLLTSFSALDAAQQKVLLSSSLLSAQQKEQCATMAALTSANMSYTAEQLTKATGVSAETLANWGLIQSTDSLTMSELAEKAASDAQAKTVLEKIIAQNAQAVANGEVTASNAALSASAGTATLATGTLTTAIKANIKAMITWMTTTPLGWLTMLVGGIVIAAKAYDALTVSVKEQKEKMEESASAYEDAKNELSNITTELETQQQELDDLIAKDRDLTNEEQNRLDTLKKSTKELRIQKDLAEREEDKTQREAAKDASDLFEKQFGKQDISENAIGDYVHEMKITGENPAFFATRRENISAKIAAYEEMNKLLNEAYSSKDRENINKYTESVKTLEDEIFATVQELQTQQDNITDWYATVEDTPYDQLSDEEQKMADNYIAIGDAIELAYNHLDPAAWKQMKIDNVFNTEDIEKTKEELVEMEKAGTLDEKMLQSYPKLSETLEENKLSAKELRQELNALAQAELEGQSSETQPTSSLLSLSDAIKAINGFKDGDTEIIGLIEEYQLLQEVLSDTGNIQEKTYAKLLSCSAKYSTAIRTENGRITVNTSKLKAVAKSRQLDTKEAIKQTLALKKQEWVQWNNNIENYNGTLLDSITINYENIDALQQQITQYELLANSLDNASSAFENFKNAQSTEDQDMYNTAQDAFNVLKGYSGDPENENFGKYNRDEFQEAAMLLMDNDTYKKALNAKDLDEYQKVVDSFVKSVEPLFDEKNYNSAANLFDRINEIMDSGDVPEADIDWAKRLGISKEMFHALSQFGNQYDFNHKEIFESYQLNTLDEYQSLLSNVKTAQEALNECTEKTGNKYDYLSMELDEAKRKYSEFKNETADTLENAYADYIHSGAKSKGDFAEYLKKSMDFDDSDITGSIDVLLDKSKSLQENLANMHPDSAAYELYKKQLEEINTLLDSLDFDMDSIDKTKSLDDKISQYKELVKEAEEYKKTLETEDSGSDSYKEAAQELERISGLMANLRDPLRLEINSNITEIDSQISQLDEKLSGLKESLQHASTSTEAHTIHMDIKGAENEKSKLEGQKEELQQTLKIIVDSTEVDEYDPEEKEGTVKYSPDFTNVINAETPKLKGTIEYEAKLPNQPTAPTSPTTKADGTFNAFAQGTGSDVSIPKNEKALVNELGEEGVVRNGKLIPIKGGAQFINLKRGDIIFNHKQMEQLKKNGYTTGRGKLIGAHAEGTVVNAFKEGTGTRPNLLNLKDVTTNNRAIQQAKNAAKETEKAAEEKTEKEKEQFEEVFDWIERRIDKFKRKFDKWIKQAETAVTSGFITKYYKKATSAIKKELSTYDKAYSRYMKEANAVGLDENYAKKIRNGTIDIETIRAEGSEEEVKKYEELADKIQKYQEWYDKAVESTTSFVETAEQLYNLPLDKAATKIEKFKDAIDLLDKKLGNAIGSKKKNNLVDKQTKEEKKTLKAEKKAKKESAKNLKLAKKEMTSSGVLKSSDVSGKEKKKIKNAVKNGKEVSLSFFKEGSKAYNAAVKYNEALKANKQATYDCAAAQQDYNSWLVEASKIKFDNIADDYDKRVQMLGHQMTALDNRISEIETAGKKVNKSYYESQKNINAQKLAQYQSEKAALEQSIQNIKKGTDEWYEAYDQIQQVSSSISDCVKETYELNNAINQLHFDLFENISESIGRIITEQEFLRGLFAHEKLTDDKTGNLTEAGLAKLGSLSASYYAAKNNAERDGAMVKELQNVRDKGRQADGSYKLGKWTFNSLEDLEAKIDETYTKWQDDIKDTYSLETEIADLMKEKYQAELDYLKDLIDAKKEALNTEKDLHDYQKSINEKTKNISTIQKQIAAYSGDSSEEGNARRQKLQKELDDAQDDLKETEYERYISDQQDMLDKLYKEYEELVTKKLDDFMKLVETGLKTANDNMALIGSYLGSVASDKGYSPQTKELFSGVSKENIQTNVTSIINAIAGKETAQSGTQTGNTPVGTSGGNSTTSGGSTPTGGTSGNGTNGNPPSSNPYNRPIAGSDGKSYDVSIAKEYIKNNAKEAAKGKKAKDFDYVNEKIYNNKSKAYSGKGKILTEAKRKGLAKELGIKDYEGSGKKEGKLAKKLHSIGFPGFKKGGVVSVDDIEKQVHENGDDGIVSVQNGEAILTPKQTDVLQQFTEKLPEKDNVAEKDNVIRTPDGVELIPVNPEDLIKELQSRSNITHNPDSMTKPDLQDFSNMIKQNVPDFSSMMKPDLPDVTSFGDTNNNINIDMGGITMNGVNNPKEFADMLAQSVQTVPKARKVIDSELCRLGGAGRLSINKIR